MDIRIAEPADLDAVTALINLAFEVERFFIEGDRISLETVRDLAAKGNFILLEDTHGLAGCIYVELRDRRAYLGLLSVDPSRQRSGIGSRLVHAAEEHCRAAGCRFVDLRIVNLRQELPPFYRRLGYRETGTAPFTPGIVTKLPCHFIEMTKPLDRAAEAGS
ncbi:MAG TPA: GNAT family N-acetyltransferase [Bryobacteraceae bacterium]|nr:GNAT family N-acetyltransferase [Bryobacteraceae bacterium]